MNELILLLGFWFLATIVLGTINRSLRERIDELTTTNRYLRQQYQIAYLQDRNQQLIINALANAGKLIKRYNC